MISQDTAGEQLAMDTKEDEQERGITIDAANVSMTHEYEDTNHLINLIDTPGHVDFGGDVTRAMRAVDGALVVVDAVEGAMPQTETVLRQALREGVKPALFINKVDRLISELQEGPQEMQERLMSVIADVNELIRGMAENMDDIPRTGPSPSRTERSGSAPRCTNGASRCRRCSGPAWTSATSWTSNRTTNATSSTSGRRFRTSCSIWSVSTSRTRSTPSPVVSRVSIWRGDAESELADTMRMVNEDGEVVFMVTDISMDPHAGEIATGRVFSGTLEKGQELYVSRYCGQEPDPERWALHGVRARGSGPRSGREHRVRHRPARRHRRLHRLFRGDDAVRVDRAHLRAGHHEVRRGAEHGRPAEAHRDAPAGRQGGPDDPDRDQRDTRGTSSAGRASSTSK